MKTVLMIVSLMNPTFEKDIKPIFMSKCYQCHNGVAKSTDWSDYRMAYQWRYEIEAKVTIYRNMPPDGNISEEERILISKWVTYGAKN